MQREPEFGFQSIIMIAVDTIAITVKNKGDKGGFCSYWQSLHYMYFGGSFVLKKGGLSSII